MSNIIIGRGPTPAVYTGVANWLTYTRVVLIVPILLLHESGYQLLAAGLVVVATITDGLDGYVARGTNTTSDWGRIADPLADKLFVNALLFIAAVQYEITLLTMLWFVNLAYDLYNTHQRWPEIRRAWYGYDHVPSNTPVTLVSKWKTFFLFVVVTLLYLPTTSVTWPIVEACMLITLVFVIVSGIGNMYRHLKH